MTFILKCTVMYNTLLLISFIITNVDSVPRDYCFGVLDRSDCGLPPTPVFSYSKPGSRCEIETWRGCPSENLFQNEYQCSDLCIGKLYRPTGEGKPVDPPNEPEDASTEDATGTNLCEEALNSTNCTGVETQVFTFDSETRTCVEATYRGCETENKFDDKEHCENSCLNSKDKWANSINGLTEQDLENLQNMLDKAEGDDDKLKSVISDDKEPRVGDPKEEKLSASVEEGIVFRQGKNY